MVKKVTAVATSVLLVVMVFSFFMIGPSVSSVSANSAPIDCEKLLGDCSIKHPPGDPLHQRCFEIYYNCLTQGG